MTPRAFSAALLLVVLTGAGSAFAGDAALAESLFRQGRDRMDKGDYAAACPMLAESFAQEETTGTLLALALCQEQAGQTASAWATFAAVVTRAKREGQAEREQAARDHLRELDAKLSRLTIKVDGATANVPGLVVKRDGLSVGRGAWGAALPVDPGEHVVEAVAPGKLAWKGPVTIGRAADSQIVMVPVLADEPAAAVAPTASPTTAAALAPDRDSVPPAKSSGLRTAGFVVGGAGIVGLAVGGYYALRASSLYKESKGDGLCKVNNDCTAAGLAKRDSSIKASNFATVGVIAGGVLMAAGVTLFFVGGPKDTRADSARVEAAPAVGHDLAGVLVRGRF